MDEALLSQLSAMGLPEGMTDPNQVLAWVVGKMKPDDKPEEPVQNMEEDKPVEEVPPVEKMEGEDDELVAKATVSVFEPADCAAFLANEMKSNTHD